MRRSSKSFRSQSASNAKGALEAIREDLSDGGHCRRHTVCIYYRQVFACKHREATQIGTWKRAAIENMATAFAKRGGDPGRADEAQIDKLHSRIGQFVMARDFLANASVQLPGTRGKKWWAATMI